MKAIIDLDWLDSFIKDYENNNFITSGEYGTHVFMARMIRSKCTIIESNDTPITEIVKENGLFHVVKPLPETCVNEWEDKKFCSESNKCLMCKK